MNEPLFSTVLNENELSFLLQRIKPASKKTMREAARRLDELAKPPGSLGRLEEIAVRLAGITESVRNELERRRVIVFAADNGVVAEGVAATPQSVTLKQAINMTKGKTGMSALAWHFNDSIEVVDCGIDAEYDYRGIVKRPIARGTGNIRRGAAMSRKDALAAMGIGIAAVKKALEYGVQLIGVGEMGIGNTTTSSAVLSVLSGEKPDKVTGRGSGLSDEAFEKKIRVVWDAIAINSPDPTDPIDVISKVGGFDIAAMTGAFIACAKERIPAVADGFISMVAALSAVRLCPAVKDFLFLAHTSAEPGCRIAAKLIGLKPYLDLDMRLGEGSGCVMAFRLMTAACAIMNDMATFEEAAIDCGYLETIKTDKGRKK